MHLLIAVYFDLQNFFQGSQNNRSRVDYCHLAHDALNESHLLCLMVGVQELFETIFWLYSFVTSIAIA